MNKRSYNIFFDLHTVSGIVVAVLTYVIFFAGSFAFFRDETANWERNEPVTVHRAIDVDLARALESLSHRYKLSGRDIDIHRGYDERRVTFNLSESRDSLLSKEERADAYLYMDSRTYSTYSYEEDYSLGEFLYRLHFFAQIPYPAGYFLSGFTALFLLFAVFTGILVHWKKLVSNFYVFRPREKLKTVWTDAHTVIGTLGLPFHIVYAVTGAFFMINILLVAPSVSLFYAGDSEKFYNDMGYAHPRFAPTGRAIDIDLRKLNGIVDKGMQLWKDYNITEITLVNYGDDNMHISLSGDLNTQTAIGGLGKLVYRYSDGALVEKKEPFTTSYLDGVKVALYRLHFGDYGGLLVKVISFVLGLLGCFVVITGILIWLEARNKKNVSHREKTFNNRVGVLFLSICLTMYPVTALAFVAMKIIPAEYSHNKLPVLYYLYFGMWMITTIYFVIRKDNYYTNKATLLAGGILGLLVPIANGVATGKWIWSTFNEQQRDLFVIDTLWIGLACASLYSVYRVRRPKSIHSTSDRDRLHHSQAQVAEHAQ